MTLVQMKISVWMIVFGLVASGFAAVGFILYAYGPCIEPFVAGYVINIPFPDRIWRGYIVKRETHREVEVGCFRYHDLRKLAPAIPDRYVFQVEARLSDKINVSAYVADADHQKSQEDFSTHPAGAVWDRSYCFEMPGTIGDDQAIRVSGHAEHTRLLWVAAKPKTKQMSGIPFPFWKSITPVPDFPILPVRCYRPDGSVDREPQECRET